MSKTIIISITTIICTLLICFTILSYSKCNRYVKFSDKSILDTQTGSLFSIYHGDNGTVWHKYVSFD